MLKKSLLLVIAAALFIAAGCSQKPEKIYPYSFDSAKIEFALTGNMEGTKTLYIKGDKMLIETHAVRKGDDGEEEKVDSLYIDTGATVYQVDLNTKTAVSAGNSIYDTLKNMPLEKRKEYLVKVGTGAIVDESIPRPTGQKEIAGKKCDLYDVQGLGQTCLWDGLSLYTSIKIPDAGIDNTSEAVSIEINAAIADSHFELPSDVQLLGQEPEATNT